MVRAGTLFRSSTLVHRGSSTKTGAPRPAPPATSPQPAPRRRRRLRVAARVGLGGVSWALLLLAGAVWAASHRDDALFVARDMAWGESDVLDYQKFPSRPVHNGAQVFRFKSDPTHERFQTIKYTVDGEAKEAAFGDFLRSTNTTSFIVVKDGAVVYERYLNGYKRDSIVTSFS